MVGAGNDFVIVEALKGVNYKKLAVKMCDRTNGIGADGLIILDKSPKADYKMQIFNADGSQAEMCGNGARCLAAYIVRHKNARLKGKRLFSIETLAGTILGEAKDQMANVRLSDPLDYKSEIPITVNGQKIHVHYIDTGVPQTIIFVDGLEDIDVNHIGRTIRFHKRFSPRGTNVNFVEHLRQGLVGTRTYERGVEDETKACGTGSVAAAIISYLKENPQTANKKKARMKVLTTSQEVLEVIFDITDDKISEVWLKGSANFVAKGEFYV